MSTSPNPGAERKRSILLDLEQVRLIRRIGEEAYPYECCGILGGRFDDRGRQVVEIFPAINQRADSPRNRYLISPEFHRSVDRQLGDRGFEIVGFFHSHPDCPAQPSEFDRDHAWPWYSYLIVSVVKGQSAELRCWVLQDDRSRFEEEAVRVGSSDQPLAAGKT